MSDVFEARLANRFCIPWSHAPLEPVDGFRADIIEAVATGARLVSLFGIPEGDVTRLVAILADDARATLGITSTRVGSRYPALTADCPQAHVFEREIWEQCGVTPEGHPWLKPLRRHPVDHRAGTQAPSGNGDRETYPFHRIDGDVHEVAVGPVHAGIIEPGHFRFQAYGEQVLFLEIVLGYQHRGVERLLESSDRTRGILVAESIAGDTVVGHAGAYCGALEALARSHKSPRAQTIRGIALELERLANHIGDLGAIAGDIAYYPAANYCGRLRGECLNLLMTLSGNRYGRGLARPGGVLFDLTPEMVEVFRERLLALRAELDPVVDLFLGTSSVQARLEGVGAVTGAQVRELGFVGPVARAAETPRDVRHDHPYGIFRFAHIPVATAWGGDVFARALVRRIEIARSLDFVLDQLGQLPSGPTITECGPLAPNEIVVALVEGWRGEIAHVVLTNERGGIRRYKVTDPSLHNWTALAVAMPGNAISDFPLCNKSFNLSYAGHDL